MGNFLNESPVLSWGPKRDPNAENYPDHVSDFAVLFGIRISGCRV